MLPALATSTAAAPSLKPQPNCKEIKKFALETDTKRLSPLIHMQSDNDGVFMYRTSCLDLEFTNPPSRRAFMYTDEIRNFLDDSFELLRRAWAEVYGVAGFMQRGICGRKNARITNQPGERNEMLSSFHSPCVLCTFGRTWKVFV